MNMLITGAASRLAQTIASELAPSHRLRLLDSASDAPPAGLENNVEWLQGSFINPDTAWRAVRDIDVLIHTGEPPPDLPEDELAREQLLLDLATRGTHVLLKAAVEAGVKRFIYGSTLEIFSAYPDDVYISELWKPLPTPEIYQMTRYLGELTCREFARDYMVTVTALRLGKLVLAEDVAGQTPDLMWLDLRDAARAFRCALTREASTEVWWTRRWAVYHICAAIPNPKFLIDQAAAMGYEPQHNFQTNEPAASIDTSDRGGT
ncbi:MAG: NAD(P)-dependent oxidoreductase [Candidatus Poribacteria bacterium]|nr:NAD(P)-dependent oxidoreductase [Candidatus Poribacteria bacterium]